MAHFEHLCMHAYTAEFVRSSKFLKIPFLPFKSGLCFGLCCTRMDVFVLSDGLTDTQVRRAQLELNKWESRVKSDLGSHSTVLC